MPAASRSQTLSDRHSLLSRHRAQLWNDRRLSLFLRTSFVGHLHPKHPMFAPHMAQARLGGCGRSIQSPTVSLGGGPILLPTRPLCTVPFPRIAEDVALLVLGGTTVPAVQHSSIPSSIISHCRYIPMPWCRRSLQDLFPRCPVPFPEIRKTLRCRSTSSGSSIEQDDASTAVERHAVVAPSSRPVNARTVPGRSVP